jgi:hypothetical protein
MMSAIHRPGSFFGVLSFLFAVVTTLCLSTAGLASTVSSVGAPGANGVAGNPPTSGQSGGLLQPARACQLMRLTPRLQREAVGDSGGTVSRVLQAALVATGGRRLPEQIFPAIFHRPFRLARLAATAGRQVPPVPRGVRAYWPVSGEKRMIMRVWSHPAR